MEMTIAKELASVDENYAKTPLGHEIWRMKKGEANGPALSFPTRRKSALRWTGRGVSAAIGAFVDALAVLVAADVVPCCCASQTADDCAFCAVIFAGQSCARKRANACAIRCACAGGVTSRNGKGQWDDKKVAFHIIFSGLFTNERSGGVWVPSFRRIALFCGIRE
ncbi:MAG: hypothetical protein ACSHWZ_13050 [Sulfitobacter sp.]